LPSGYATNQTIWCDGSAEYIKLRLIREHMS